jgi:hypothetical protein
MKAITIRQPWSSLIMDGEKTIEVRSWEPKHLGWVIVHAGRNVDPDACKHFETTASTLQLGKVLGAVHLTSSFRFTEELWNELQAEHCEFSSYDPKFFGWRIRDPIKLNSPATWSGKLGMFDIDDSIDFVQELLQRIRCCEDGSRFECPNNTFEGENGI